MATVSFQSLFLSPPPSLLRPLTPCNSSRLPLVFPVTSPSQVPTIRVSYFRRNGGGWTISSFPAVSLLISEAEPAQATASTSGSDDRGAFIISTLLFIAFISLSILTVGVAYIAVTDFLQKRESDKFEKEEALKKKKSRKKGKIANRAKAAGPRGFGQKMVEDDEVDS